VDYTPARHNMVESQLRTNKVTELRLLEAFETIPRELFVPEGLRGIAYVDKDIAVAAGRYLLEPMVLARLIQAAEIMAEDIVLEIGCATGYASAILSRIAATVVCLESDHRLAEEANATLENLGIDNVAVVEGELTAGYAKQAPYNAILIGAAVAEVPQAIYDQLAEGGRLVSVIKQPPEPGRASLMRRSGQSVSRRVLFDANSPLLPGFTREPGFVF
jgi:protein-L-isoaspartate(D-aspartate) O-methyltransferase